jgi:hypothetical protein
VADTETICYRCRKVLAEKSAEDARGVFECAGCGGSCFGGFSVEPLNDLERRRCKNAFQKSTREILEAAGVACTRLSSPSGSAGGGDRG